MMTMIRITTMMITINLLLFFLCCDGMIWNMFQEFKFILPSFLSIIFWTQCHLNGHPEAVTNLCYSCSNVLTDYAVCCDILLLQVYTDAPVLVKNPRHAPFFRRDCLTSRFSNMQKASLRGLHITETKLHFPPNWATDWSSY